MPSFVNDCQRTPGSFDRPDGSPCSLMRCVAVDCLFPCKRCYWYRWRAFERAYNNTLRKSINTVTMFQYYGQCCQYLIVVVYMPPSIVWRFVKASATVHVSWKYACLIVGTSRRWECGATAKMQPQCLLNLVKTLDCTLSANTTTLWAEQLVCLFSPG